MVDCFDINDWQPLKTLFLNTGIVKLLHSCSEDIEVFQCLLQTQPSPVVDTQLAAAMAGMGFSIGYSSLIKNLLDVEIDKEQTRSDWLRRPLSERQIHYAANDVYWLPAAWSKLESLLQQKDRLSWCLQDCAKLVAQDEISDDDGLDFYKRLRGIWRLNSKELNVVRALCAWREKQARADNVPRGRILSDANIIELSRRAPSTIQQLEKLDGLRLSKHRQFDQIICEIIAEAIAADPTSWPKKLLDRTAPAFKAQIKTLKALVEKEAEAHEIPPELLGRKKELEKYIENPESSEIARGWRGVLLLDKIAQAKT